MASFDGYKRLLVAVDFDHEPDMIIAKACNIATQYNAQIRLIHCVAPMEDVYVRVYGLEGLYGVESLTRLHDEIIQESDERLASFVGKFPEREIECKTVEGNIVDEIMDAAEEYEADLIILGSHACHGLQLLLGSTANGVLHRASCDALMIRAD